MAAKKKEPENSLAGWADIIKRQGEQNETMAFFDRADELDKNRQEAIELFHQLWGEAHDSPDYNKENWKRMQFLLNKLGIEA